MKPTYRFYIRGDYVQISINFNYKKIRKSTGILAENFDGVRVKGKSEYAQQSNRLLRKLADTVEYAENYEQACAQVSKILNTTPQRKGEEPKDATLAAFMQQYIDEKASKKSRHTQYNFESMYRTYQEFIGDSRDVIPVEVDITRMSVHERPGVIRKMDHHWQGFKQFMVDKGLAPSSQREYLTKLRSVLKWIRKSYGIEVPGEVPNVKVVFDTISLPPNSIKAFIQSDRWYEDPILMSTYLFAKIQVFTTWRFSDAISVKMSDIIPYEDAFYITRFDKKRTRKTINRLHPNVYKEIKIKGFGEDIYAPELMRYSRPTRLQIINQKLKEVFSDVPGMHEKVALTLQRPDSTIEREYKTYLSQLTSHVLRKSAITYYSYEHVAEKHIKMSSGHTPSSQSYSESYDLVVGTEFDRDMGRAQDNFYK